MKELRVCQIRADTPVREKSFVLEGWPIVFDTPTEINDPIGCYTEVIRKTALGSTDLSDIRLFYNHDLNKVPLAKTPRTMKFFKSEKGLKMIAELPDTEEAKSVYTAVKRGDLSGMSFAFKVPKGGDIFNPKTKTREIFKIEKVYEISIVPFPAYPQTSVEARAIIQKLNNPARNKAKIIINQIFRSVSNYEF